MQHVGRPQQIKQMKTYTTFALGRDMLQHRLALLWHLILQLILEISNKVWNDLRKPSPDPRNKDLHVKTEKKEKTWDELSSCIHRKLNSNLQARRITWDQAPGVALLSGVFSIDMQYKMHKHIRTQYPVLDFASWVSRIVRQAEPALLSLQVLFCLKDSKPKQWGGWCSTRTSL